MTPSEKLGYKIGDVFTLAVNVYGIPEGTTVYLIHDDGSSLPQFSIADVPGRIPCSFGVTAFVELYNVIPVENNMNETPLKITDQFDVKIDKNPLLHKAVMEHAKLLGFATQTTCANYIQFNPFQPNFATGHNPTQFSKRLATLDEFFALKKESVKPKLVLNGRTYIINGDTVTSESDLDIKYVELVDFLEKQLENSKLGGHTVVTREITVGCTAFTKYELEMIQRWLRNNKPQEI